MCNLSFGTKAETLQRLWDSLKSARVKPVCLYTTSDWEKRPEGVISEIQSELPGSVLIIRSSASSEDAESQSNAGAYCTVAGVDSSSAQGITSAVERVISSYGKIDGPEQFFVQEQITDISISGVLFTREGDTLAPYYVVNYDDQSGSHESVTAGNSDNLKTYIRFRESPNEPVSEEMSRLLKAAKEIEGLFNCDSLDIEFAFDGAGDLYILQVRPIVLAGKPTPISQEDFTDYLNKIYHKIRRLNQPYPGLGGSRAIYSVMTDWNPAEMIGVKPRKLSLSLYKELITDSIWAYQRDNYGYQNLRSFPLLVSFLGCPYIDVRASLNSFIPKTLEGKIADKLVDYYTNELLKSPADHDKVEFNIIFSCYYLDMAQKIKRLLDYGFSELEVDRIKFSLLEITNNIINENTGLFHKDMERIHHLEKRFDEIANGDLHIIDKIYWLIEDCKRYGTLPFAGLARAGFIAVQLFRSIIELGIMSQEEGDAFMRSLNTVSNRLSTDMASFRKEELSREDLLSVYGHLRPGTYDIMSLRYDEAFEMYLENNDGNSSSEQEMHQDFELNDALRERLDDKLHEAGLMISADRLFGFIKDAIEGREYGKFVFTRSLSHVLKLIEMIGYRFEVSREELANLDIRRVMDLYANLTHEDVKEILERDIEKNKREHEVTKFLKLPQLITTERSVYDFFLTKVEPNFVTLRDVTSIIVLEEDLHDIDLEGKIVFIKGADPGYDWIFSRQIGGLITMYGGANSHMAIRCAELEVPAVVGCGEQNYEIWSKARTLSIDCSNKQVTILS